MAPLATGLLTKNYRSLLCLNNSFLLSTFSRLTGEAYDELTPIQKQWLVQWTNSGGQINYSYVKGKAVALPPSKPKKCIKVKPFVHTPSPVIAVELLEATHWSDGQIIEETCFNQLMRVINFAHDHGGKRVVIINHTNTFSNEALLEQIIKQMPESEKERTINRLTLLLGIHP